MRKIESVEITGKSGTAYNFNIYPYPMTFNDFIGGVYIIAKVEEGHTDVFHMAETDNIDPLLKGSECKEKLSNEGANRIALYRNANKDVRLKVLDDVEELTISMS